MSLIGTCGRSSGPLCCKGSFPPSTVPFPFLVFCHLICWLILFLSWNSSIQGFFYIEIYFSFFNFYICVWVANFVIIFLDGKFFLSTLSSTYISLWTLGWTLFHRKLLTWISIFYSCIHLALNGKYCFLNDMNLQVKVDPSSSFTFHFSWSLVGLLTKFLICSTTNLICSSYGSKVKYPRKFSFSSSFSMFLIFIPIAFVWKIIQCIR